MGNHNTFENQINNNDIKTTINDTIKNEIKELNIIKNIKEIKETKTYHHYSYDDINDEICNYYL